MKDLLPCGTPADVAEGNRLSDRLFADHVRRIDLVDAPPREIPDGLSSAEGFGAVGDGVASDTESLQHALDDGKRVWLESGKVYRIGESLVLRDGRELLSDGTATILLAAGERGFRNAKPNHNAIFGPKGTGLRIEGNRVRVQHLFLVKEYEDDFYVVGVAIVPPVGGQSRVQDVLLNRVRMRGFSLAPGIVSICSGERIVVSNSIIHAGFSQSAVVDPDRNALFQITGVTVDDYHPTHDSTDVRIVNNVITDLWFQRVEKQPGANPPPWNRGDQSDGVNFHAVRTGQNLIVEHNYIANVAEGIDSFAANLTVRHNVVAGRECAIKLIHGARDSVYEDNIFAGKLTIAGACLYPPNNKHPQTGLLNPDERVRNIQFRRNVFDMRCSPKPAVRVDDHPEYPPQQIVLTDTRFLVSAADSPTVVGPGCEQHDSATLLEGLLPLPAKR